MTLFYNIFLIGAGIVLLALVGIAAAVGMLWRLPKETPTPDRVSNTMVYSWVSLWVGVIVAVVGIAGGMLG